MDAYRQYVLQPNDAPPSSGAVRVTWYGTTMYVVDDGETQLRLPIVGSDSTLNLAR